MIPDVDFWADGPLDGVTMRKVIVCSLLLVLVVSSTVDAMKPVIWHQRLGISGSASALSPGSSDGDIFQASMGWGISALYWYKFQTQIVLRASYSKLKANDSYWAEKLAPGEVFNVWRVKAQLFTVSVEFRRMFPTDAMNFLYIGGGPDLFFFDTIQGKYEIYGSGLPQKGTLIDERVPALCGGAHITPGMFIVLNRKMYLDVGVQVHLLIDGIRNPYWLEPTFTLTYRIF
ncbi:hypothetical protein CEE37_05375 [candidate division LCP-89 bacterium B3_LCP]|uniref:Outer membrane protein beta-barrel domain-containing protein n=1 Tax=candidate division LCP-89 bacterium B3_LCP TaxID=2012998 RepID=A0A532V1T7_UNCL8|nr:MAG: hypothetical protein CEE37_05375 [candidate division LCP-89 bacterium B3_LCP]